MDNQDKFRYIKRLYQAFLSQVRVISEAGADVAMQCAVQLANNMNQEQRDELVKVLQAINSK